MWLICQIHGVAHGVGPESRIFNGACEQRGESQINFAAEFIVCENIPSIPLNFTEPLREKGDFLSPPLFSFLTVFNLKPIFPISFLPLLPFPCEFRSSFLPFESLHRSAKSERRRG